MADNLPAEPKGAPPEEYLGDGVYASFDGYHLWLAVNHHTDKVVALEPAVLEALDRYRARLKAYYSGEPG